MRNVVYNQNGNNKVYANKLRKIQRLRALLVLLSGLIVATAAAGGYIILFHDVTTADEPFNPAIVAPISADDTLIYDAISKTAWPIDKSIIEDPQKYKLQILYTEIIRNGSQIEFVPHTYGVDDNTYFYPASAIKLAAVLGAAHKANTLGGDIHSVYEDTLNAKGPLSMYMGYILSCSDNLSFDVLFDFLGQNEFNRLMWENDYLSVRAVGHLAGRYGNNFSPAYTLKLDKGNSHAEPMRPNTIVNANDGLDGLLVGTSHMNGGKVINEPYDFTNSNRVTLMDMQDMLKQIFFISTIPVEKRFNLTGDDIKFLRREMLSAGDGSYKWFFCGGRKETPKSVSIYSKSGIASGFLTDNAYVKDDKGNEFLLSATIYCNSDGVVNDDRYDYETVGLPFLKNLGMVFWDVTKERNLKNAPSNQSNQ